MVVSRVGLEEQDNRRPRGPDQKASHKGHEDSGRVRSKLLANGWTIEKALENYPQLKREDVIAALKYATEVSKKARPPA